MTTATQEKQAELRPLIDELREAAKRIRDVVTVIRRRQMRVHSQVDLIDAVARCKAMGFSKTEQALAVAAVLEEASDRAWLHIEVPSAEVLAVARFVNAVEVES